MEHPAIELARVPRRPTRGDLLLAGILGAWALFEALVLEGPKPRAVTALVGLAYAAAIVWRRRAPVASMLAIAGTAVVFAVASQADPPYEGAMPFPCLIVATFSAALYIRRLPVAIATGAVPLAVMVFLSAYGFFTNNETNSVVDYMAGSFILASIWTGGRIVRRRALQLQAAREASGELAREAVAEERARIARELHDVVAHSVSVVTVQAGAAEQLLERDPERARTHLAAVQRSAQEALREMRRLLGVLREDVADFAPQPGLGRLGELVEEARSAGLPVELREDGDRGELGAGVDLAAYRIVQEALTNVRKHAGHVPTTVTVSYGEEDLAIEVRNARGTARNGGGSGHGLLGMGERARVYGGTLDAGPDGDGGFRVAARLPR